MEYLEIGEVTNTHGVKGEIRIRSPFKYKDEVFKEKFNIFIGKEKEQVEITRARMHKGYNMVLLKGYDNINEVLMYKGEKVYVKREDLNTSEVLIEELVGARVNTNSLTIGIIKNTFNNNAHDILVIQDSTKTHMIPFVDNYIEKYDRNSAILYVKNVEGILNEY